MNYCTVERACSLCCSVTSLVQAFMRQIEFVLSEASTGVQRGKKEKSEALPGGHGGERTSPRARRRAAGREDRCREDKETGEAQTHLEQTIGRDGLAKRQVATLVKSCCHRNVPIHDYVACIPRTRCAADETEEGVSSIGRGGQRYRRTRRKRNCTHASAVDACGAAGDHPIGPTGRHVHGKNVRGRSLRASETRRAVYCDRHLVAYDVIGAVMHGGKDLRHATICIRRDNSGAGKLRNLRIARLPRRLTCDLDSFRRMNVRAVSFVLEKCRRVHRGERAIPWLNTDRN